MKNIALSRYLMLGAACLAVLSASAWAQTPQHNPDLQSSRAQSSASAAMQSQMKGLMQQWMAAAVGFAHQAGSAIPWNQVNSTVPINYAPMFLYAGPGGAAACQFNGSAGTALPVVAGINLASPVNLAGLRLVLPAAASGQAIAYQNAIGAGNTFFPAQSGGPLDGTFCASVAYNQPAAQQIQVVTWYAPSATALAQGSGAGETPKMMLYSAAQSFTNAINQSPLGGSAQPLYGNNITATASSWMTQSTSKAARFMGGMTGQ